MEYNEYDFTVLMSVYHADDPVLFIRAVDSVYQNYLRPSEMILVVDGEVNALLDYAIVQMTQRYGIHCHRLRRNRGLAVAFNLFAHLGLRGRMQMTTTCPSDLLLRYKG